MRQVLVLTLVVVSSSLSIPHVVGKNAPSVNFDRGVDVSAILREVRSGAKNAPAVASRVFPAGEQNSCNEALRQEAIRRHEAIRGGIGPQAVIRGTPGDDVQNGTPEADVIYGFEGADQQFGKGGDDVIFPGPGPGAARVEGGEGRDVVILHDTGWVRFRDLYLNEAQKTSIVIIETELVVDGKGNCIGPS